MPIFEVTRRAGYGIFLGKGGFGTLRKLELHGVCETWLCTVSDGVYGLVKEEEGVSDGHLFIMV